ncbi:hypothetical protein [Opitutus sp. ER46]|uniref:hypothetical protein n=1 Tax=Opitutus sp. ER46 TaxID=2161864 RepID=UPI000D313998|nr:hypothetical protein [Opitutus sp. ER46]PTX91798.1 hypothetical protein DB354_18250 [Opitutus sp. ER46]
MPKSAMLPLEMMALICRAGVELGGEVRRAGAVRTEGAPGAGRRGRTLRPGEGTPLWNALRRRLGAELRFGDQARLARMLGLPRQRVNEFLTGGRQMPDAERALQLLAAVSALAAERTADGVEADGTKRPRTRTKPAPRQVRV